MSFPEKIQTKVKILTSLSKVEMKMQLDNISNS